MSTHQKPHTCNVAVRVVCTVALIAQAAAAIPSVAQEPIRVRAENAPLWGSSVRLIPKLTLGVADGPPEYALGEIEHLAVRGDGSFFTYDWKDKQIRSYDQAGKFLRKVGRLGDGPGEYRLLQGMALLDDSVLVAWDPRNKRLSYFGSDGKLLSSRVLVNAPGFFGPNAFDVDAQGVHYFRTSDSKRRQANGDLSFKYIRFSRTGNLIDTIRPPLENAGPGATSMNTADGRRANFHVMNVSALYPGGFVQGRNDEYAIVVPTSPSGKPVVIERPFTRVTASSEEIDEWDALAVRIARSQPKPHPQVITGPRFEARPTPRTKPVFRSLFADHDGRIWVELYVTAIKGANYARGAYKLTWREPTTYDVLQNDGTYLGRVELPPRSTLMAARGNTLWLTSTGPDDEPIVAAYTISGAVR
jgi:hypothetical protein